MDFLERDRPSELKLFKEKVLQNMSSFFNDLKATYPIIQFYDEFGNMFLPNRVIVEIKNKKIKLWSPYKMIINISIMG